MKRYVWVGFLLFLGMFLISAYGENKGEILKTSGKADMTQVASMRSGKAVFDKTCQLQLQVISICSSKQVKLLYMTCKQA